MKISFNKKQQRGLQVGLMLYVSEAAQSIFLIPYFKFLFGPKLTTSWLMAIASAGLVNLAYSGYYSPIIRNISNSTSDGRSSLPVRVDSLCRKMRKCGFAILMTSQIMYFFYVASHNALNKELIEICGIIYLSQYFRLEAFGKFAIINGAKEVGADKLILLNMSIFTFLLVMISAWCFGTLLAPALSILITSIGLAYSATRFLHKFQTQEKGNDDYFPGLREQLKLILISISGFMNMSTDILLAVTFLPPTKAVEFSLLSKILAIPLSAVGLLIQIKFPFWAASEPSLFRFNKRLMITRKIIFAVCALLAVALLFSLVAKINIAKELSYFVIFIMLSNIMFALMTVIIGQYLIAHNYYGFANKSILVGVLSPVIAYGVGSIDKNFFMVGFLIANFALFTVHVTHLLQMRPDKYGL